MARIDPVNRLGLTDDSVFYRTMETTRVKEQDGQLTIAGNPNSAAKLSNHFAIEPNPVFDPKTFILLPDDFKKKYSEDASYQYKPVVMPASELDTPTLNVAYGSRSAIGVVSGYGDGKENNSTIKMTLGDLRRAGGGQVFYDESTARGRTEGFTALLVTLPEGKRISVEDVSNSSSS